MTLTILYGNLTRDPELRYTASGASVASFCVAQNEVWKTPSGEKKEHVNFIDVEVWGKAGEAVAKYITKGSPILVEGRLRQDRWETETGDKRSKIKVVAHKVEFLGSKKESQTQESCQQLSDDLPF